MYGRPWRPTGTLRVIVPAIAIALVARAFAMYAPAALVPQAYAWTVETQSHTESEVRDTWGDLKPTYAGTPYAVTPSWSAPYATGSLTGGFTADGLKMINFGRFLAGLPPVSLSADLNSTSQYGAVLLASSNFSHTPDQPVGMDKDFYDKALSSTQSSNIGMGYTDAESFQKGCLDDNDAYNLPQVGHRRWLLNPRMLYTGIGYASASHTTYAFDTSRPSGEVSYHYVSWPSAGVFPVEFINSATPWSITLNPERYAFDQVRAGHTVTLKRLGDGRTWTIDENDTSTSGEYFSANFGGYGVRNVFIFRPGNLSGYQPGDQFDVTLSGGIYDKATGAPATIRYRTSFGALSGAPTTFAFDTATTAEAPPVDTSPPPTTSPVPLEVFRFYNLANGSHFYTASAAERQTVIERYSATYRFEGTAYVINTANPDNSVPLFRFYNRSNGSHFYTASAIERQTVIDRYSATYAFEGTAYNVSVTSSDSPVYRFYNRSNGSHFYTISATERDTVIARFSGTYTYEGICFYVGQ